MPRCLFNRNEPIFNSFVYFIVRHSQIYTQLYLYIYIYTHTHLFQNCFLISAREREQNFFLLILFNVLFFRVDFHFIFPWMKIKYFCYFIFHRFFFTTHFSVFLFWLKVWIWDFGFVVDYCDREKLFYIQCYSSTLS